jgi:hypothetical protein
MGSIVVRIAYACKKKQKMLADMYSFVTSVKNMLVSWKKVQNVLFLMYSKKWAKCITLHNLTSLNFFVEIPVYPSFCEIFFILMLKPYRLSKWSMFLNFLPFLCCYWLTAQHSFPAQQWRGGINCQVNWYEKFRTTKGDRNVADKNMFSK